MSLVAKKIEDVETSMTKLIDTLEYAALTAVDIKHLLKMADRLLECKSKIEFSLTQNHTDITADIVNIEQTKLKQLTPVQKRVVRSIPKDILIFQPYTDVLLTDESVCLELGIKTCTLTRWRRNWYTLQDIGFPPPVIYVYCSPHWTKRLLEWWINESNEKVHIKGRSDDI